MALEFPEDIILASRYVKQALPIMIKNQIPPNPCNFALWYSYVSNRDYLLKQKLDETIAKEGTCPENTTRMLFERHVIKEETDLQQHLQDSLSSVIDDLSGDVQKTQSGAKEFGRSLEQSLNTLIAESSPKEIEETVKDLIENTKIASVFTNNFQQQLQAAEAEISALKKQLIEKEKDVYIDALTQIGNRRAFDKKLVQLVQSDEPATLVLVDLDHFKNLNDTYGHLMGDKVLQGVGQVLTKICPENTLAARYGGEEFAILISGEASEGFDIAENVRAMLEKLLLKKKGSDEVIDNVTASFGVAQRAEGEYPEQLIDRADKALYSAKQAGRNRVELAA